MLHEIMYKCFSWRESTIELFLRNMGKLIKKIKILHRVANGVISRKRKVFSQLRIAKKTKQNETNNEISSNGNMIFSSILMLL